MPTSKDMTFRNQEVPFAELQAWEQVAEIFYARITELAKVVFLAISRAYPYEDREKNPQVKFHYEESLRQVRQHRNEFKNKVSAFLKSVCKVRRHNKPYDAAEDLPTTQLRGFLHNQFNLLYNRYIEYADLLLPEEHIPTFLKTLELRAQSEIKLLLDGAPPEGVAFYEIDPILKEDDFKEQYGRQVSIHRRTRRPNAEVYGGDALPYHDHARNRAHIKPSK